MSAAGHGLGLAMAIIFLSGEVTCYSVPRSLQRRTYRHRWRGWGCWRCPRPWWAPGPRASLSSSTSPSTRCSRGRGWACAGSWSRSGTRSTWTGWVSRVTRVTCQVSQSVTFAVPVTLHGHRGQSHGVGGPVSTTPCHVSRVTRVTCHVQPRDGGVRDADAVRQLDRDHGPHGRLHQQHRHLLRPQHRPHVSTS